MATPDDVTTHVIQLQRRTPDAAVAYAEGRLSAMRDLHEKIGQQITLAEGVLARTREIVENIEAAIGGES